MTFLKRIIKQKWKLILARKRKKPKMTKYPIFGAENENEFRSASSLMAWPEWPSPAQILRHWLQSFMTHTCAQSGYSCWFLFHDVRLSPVSQHSVWSELTSHNPLPLERYQAWSIDRAETSFKQQSKCYYNTRSWELFKLNLLQTYAYYTFALFSCA